MIFEVLVKPNSKKGPLILEHDGKLTVYLREKPIENEANVALVRLLSKHFNVSKSQVTLKSGQRGHKKLIEIS